METIENCLKERKIISSLILLYSAIDSFSALTEKNNIKGKSVFKNWVKTWMLKKYPLKCNEVDIYSARCGLLHLQTSESDLSKEGKARELHYCFGNANLEVIEKAIDESGNNAVAIKIEDLIYSFRNGMADCLFEAEKDEGWIKLIEERGNRFFDTIFC